MEGIGDIIKKSLELSFKNKILWIFSMLLIGASGYRFSSNITSNSNTSKNTDYGIIQNQYKSRVLGTKSEPSPIGDIDDETETGISYEEDRRITSTKPYSPNVFSYTDIPYIFSMKLIDLISRNLWLIAITISLAVPAYLILAMIKSAWATGGLLGGIRKSINGEECKVKELGFFARKGLKKRIFLILLTGFVSFFILFIVIAVDILIMIMLRKSMALMIILLLLFNPIFFVLLIYVSLAKNFSIRLITYEDVPVLDAFINGFHLLYRLFGKTILIIAINMIVFFIIMTLVGVTFLISGGISTLILKEIEGYFLIVFSLFLVGSSLTTYLVSILGISFAFTYSNYCITFLYDEAYLLVFGNDSYNSKLLQEIPNGTE